MAYDNSPPPPDRFFHKVMTVVGLIVVVIAVLMAIIVISRMATQRTFAIELLITVLLAGSAGVLLNVGRNEDDQR